MLYIIFILSFITILFFAMQFSIEKKNRRIALNLILAIASIISLSLFVFVQKASGNPDDGMEVWQFYLPVIAYTFFILYGFVTCIGIIRRPSGKRESRTK